MSKVSEIEANLKVAKEELAGLLTKAEKIRKPYEGKLGNMNGQEATEYENILTDCDKATTNIGLLEKELKIQRFATASNNALGFGGKESEILGGGNGGDDSPEALGKKAFRKFILGGKNNLNQDDYKSIAAVTSVKAYQADDPVSGGFLVSPQQFVQQLITLMKDLVFIRAMATTFQVPRAESLGIPALDTDPSDADWTTELATGNEETTFSFGKRELRPHPVAKLVKLSNKLIRQATLDPEAILQDRLAYKFGVTEEKAFLTGDGNDKPLGIFTASSLGIPTSRDTTAASSSAIAGDDLIKTKYSLKAQYRKNASWIINRAVLSAVRRLKDQNNNYIWATGLGPGGGFQGTSPTLLELPYSESEYAPGTLTTGLYVAALGDWKYYYIADALDFQLQVLDQLYAATNQTGYIGRKEVDGMPVLGEAFARLILA